MNAQRKSRTPWIAGGVAAAVLVVAVVVVIVLIGGDEEEAPAPPAEPVAEVTVDEIPEGAVALVVEVSDGTVTQEDFDAGLERAAIAAGLREPPTIDDPQYEQFRDQALSEALLSLWIEGEAADRGVSVTDVQVDDQLETIVDQSFDDEEEFEKFSAEQGFCTEEELATGPAMNCAGVREQVEVQLFAEAIQEEALGGAAPDDPEAEELAADFEQEFVEKWRLRTACAEDYVTDRCSNGPEPSFEQATVPPAAPPGAPPAAPPPGAVPEEPPVSP